MPESVNVSLECPRRHDVAEPAEDDYPESCAAALMAATVTGI